MRGFQVPLRQNEEILHQAEWAMLTNQRIVATLNKKNRSEITDDVDLSDIATFKQTNGGQESKMQPGLVATAFGVIMLVAQVLLSLAGFFSTAPPQELLAPSEVISQQGTLPSTETSESSFIDGFPRIIEVVLFLGSAAGILIGFYFIVGSLLRIKPFTVVVFVVVGSRDIPVHFPGKDNLEASHMTRLFVRAKRGI